MTFFGDAQGAWYTVGCAMAATIERAEGRAALVADLCDGSALLRRYNRAATAWNRTRSPADRLPLWSARLLEQLAG
jgi:hypothetical protein